MSQDPQRIADLVEIEQLCARYLAYASQFVPDQWLKVFTPDVEYSAFGTKYSIERMLRFLEEHPPFRRVMERVNRVLMGGAADPRARVQAAMLAAGIAGAVIHPLVLDLEDESLRSQLLKEARKLLPLR